MGCVVLEMGSGMCDVVGRFSKPGGGVWQRCFEGCLES